MVVADETGVAGSQFIATKDGFAVRAVDVDVENGHGDRSGRQGVVEEDTDEAT